MGFRPLSDRVLVLPDTESEQKTTGGIIIPDTAKEKPQQGKVVSLGNGKRLENGEILKIDVKKGDQVLYGKYAGTEIKMDGKSYLILREDEILGVM